MGNTRRRARGFSELHYIAQDIWQKCEACDAPIAEDTHPIVIYCPQHRLQAWLCNSCFQLVLDAMEMGPRV